MDPITLLFVGLQIGVSLYNQSRNSELTALIKEEQRKAKLDEIKNNQRRDMERFQHLCQLQEEMEVAAHVHRIEKIQQDFLNTFGKMAHKENLDSHYHLNVSPYVIQRSIIPLTISDLKNTRQELFCILTVSNDETFNKNVLPYLDEAICDVISKYWNESCNHTLCYYQNLWDSESNTFSNEDVENIKSLINTPTVSVSPWFQKKGDKHNLILKISVWGVGNENSLFCETDTGICFDTLPSKYSIQEISEFVERILPYTVCSVGQIADVYYWVTNYLPPHLPYLIGNGYIKVSKKLTDEYTQAYSQFYKHLVIGTSNEDESIDRTLAEVTEINQYTFPERSLACLNSIIALTAKSPLTSEMIKGSMLSFYRARTDKTPSSIDSIDASLIKKQDIMYVKMLIELTQQAEDHELKRELSELIYKYITSWR